MNRLPNPPVRSRTWLTLMLTGAVVAQIGCRSLPTSRTASGIPAAPDRESKAALASPSGTPPRAPQRYSIVAETGASATNPVFSQYDPELVAAICQSWYRLLDSTSGVGGKGKVVVQFQLHSKGSVSDVQITSSTMSEPFDAICRKAVLDPAPFAPSPEEMRRFLTNESRVVKLVFYFN
jgi:TonB family protein